MLKIKAGKNRNAGLYRSWTRDICDIFLVRFFRVYYGWIIFTSCVIVWQSHRLSQNTNNDVYSFEANNTRVANLSNRFFMHKKRTFQITTCYIAQYLWLILVLFILCLVQLENKCVWSLIIGPKYIAWRNNWDKFNPWMHQLAFGHVKLSV